MGPIRRKDGVVEAGEERLGGCPPAEACGRSLGLSPGSATDTLCSLE